MRPQPLSCLILGLALVRGDEAAFPRHALDRSGGTVAHLGDRSLSAEDYKHWLMADLGLARVRDFALDLALADEVTRLGLATEVAGLARPRDGEAPIHGLRRARMTVLAKARRIPDAARLRALFDERYGVDGVRVEVRQLLVSLNACRHRLVEAGTEAPAEAEVEAAAEARAKDLSARIAAGTEFGSLLGESDDPETRSLVARGAAGAGVLAGYNYQRYGEPFAEAVRGLAVGKVSSPVRTSHGFHLIEVLSRKTTRYETVADEIRRDFLAAAPDAFELRALADELLRRHGFRLGR